MLEQRRGGLRCLPRGDRGFGPCLPSRYSIAILVSTHVGTLVHDLAASSLDRLAQRVDNLGVELGACARAQFLEHHLSRRAQPVGAVRRYCLDRVRDTEDAGLQGDRLALEPGRVAGAVIPLVMISSRAV